MKRANRSSRTGASRRPLMVFALPLALAIAALASIAGILLHLPFAGVVVGCLSVVAISAWATSQTAGEPSESFLPIRLPDLTSQAFPASVQPQETLL